MSGGWSTSTYSKLPDNSKKKKNVADASISSVESDAGVFTFLLDNLGVKDVQFEELIALDADFIRQLSPVYGVIFLFKYPTGEKPDNKGKPNDGEFDYAAAENLFCMGPFENLLILFAAVDIVP